MGVIMSGAVSTGHGIISVIALKLNARGQRINGTNISVPSLFLIGDNVDRKFDAFFIE